MVTLTPITHKLIEIPENEVDSAIWYPTHNLTENAAPDWLQKYRDQHQFVRNIIHMARRADSTRRSLTTSLSVNAESLYEYRRFIGLSKTKSISDLLMEKYLKPTTKTVVFAVHRDVIVDLKERLRSYGSGVVFAGSSPVLRRKALKKFREGRKHTVLIVAVKAANASLDLSFADRVIFAEPSWRLDENTQAIMRVHNINQKKPVEVEWMHIGREDRIIADVFRSKTKELLS